MDNKVNETQESFEEAAAVERPASSEVKVDSKELAEFIVGVLSDRKATDIRLLRVAEKRCYRLLRDLHSNSNTQIKGIAGEIDAKVAENTALPPQHRRLRRRQLDIDRLRLRNSPYLQPRKARILQP